MKLCKFDTYRWGLVQDDLIKEVTGPIKQELTGHEFQASSVKLETPFFGEKIICSGANYPSHFEGDDRLERPELFLKTPNTLLANGGTLEVPEGVGKVVGETELVVVIGKPGKNITEEDAEDHILGYTVANDMTAVEFADMDMQWTRAKSMDGFCPLADYVTLDKSWANKSMTTLCDKNQVLEGNTSDMIFKVNQLVAYVSQWFSLVPGDLILTGSPKGAIDIESGAVIMSEIEGIGRLKFSVK